MIKLRAIHASTIASMYAIWFVVLVTVWAELNPNLKNWLKHFSGHHWVSKGLLMAAIYVLVFTGYYYLRRNTPVPKTAKLLALLNGSAILGTLILIIFFMWHS
jgi:hypothetical protein